MKKLTTIQVWEKLKTLAGAEAAFMDYSVNSGDFLSFQPYLKFFKSQSLSEHSLYRFYFPIDPFSMPFSSSREMLPTHLNGITTMPGYDFSICKLISFPACFLHSCDYFTFVILLEGSWKINLKSNAIDMNPGDFYIIPAGVSYGLGIQRESICLCMDVKTSFIAANFQNIFLYDPRVVKFMLNAVSKPEEDMYCCFHTSLCTEIFDMLLSIFSEYLSQDKFSSSVMDCLLTVLFAEILRRDDTKWECSEGHSRQEDHMYLISNYIQQNYQTATLDGLAESIHFSKQYVCRIIKQQTGSTFSDMLGSARIDMACKFLTESKLTLEEIAFLCGFSEASNMTRQFKSKMGIPPSTYRKQHTADL